VAAELARLLPRRGVVQLTGNLGAGKTTLVAGLVEALGVAPAAAVTSPTFSLIHEYGEPGAGVPHRPLPASNRSARSSRWALRRSSSPTPSCWWSGAKSSACSCPGPDGDHD
jgi:predicted ATPase